MPYMVMNSGQVVTSGATVEVVHGGVLTVGNERAEIDLYLAPGQWESVHWEDEPS